MRNRVPLKRQLLLMLACAGAFSCAANATTHVACVSSADGLAAALAALSTAAGNDDADEIRIRTGFYQAPAGGWKGAVTTHHDLAIRGWTRRGRCWTAISPPAC